MNEVIANWSDFETESDSSEDECDLSSENDDVDDDDATESEKEEVETEVEKSVRGAFRGRGGRRAKRILSNKNTGNLQLEKNRG